MTLKMEIKEEPMMVDNFDSLYHPETSSSVPAYSGLPPSPQSSPSSSASSSSSSTSPEMATRTSEGKLLVPSDIHVMSSPTTLPSTPVTLNSSSPSPKSSLSIAETSFLSLSQSTWSSSSSSSTVSSSPSSLSSVSSTLEKLAASADCKDCLGKVRPKFSIEEILKPSFGSKKSQDFHENQSPVVLQPLDMRKHSLIDKEHGCKAEKPQVGLCEENSCHHYGSCDEFSNCSSSSNSSSPEGVHNRSSNSNSSNGSRCSDTNNSFSMKYDKFGQHLTQDMRSIFAMSSYHKEAIPFFTKCQFPAAIPYHNALNQYFYGFNISSLRNQIFHDIKMSRLLMDPQNIYQNNARNQIFQMNPKDFNEDVKLPLYNNSALSSDISKSPRPANLASVSSSSVRQCFDRTSVATCRNADTRRAQSTELNKNTSSHTSNISKSFQNNSNSCSNNSVISSNNSSSIKSDNGDAPNGQKEKVPFPLPAWVYCTRYSDRPSSGPRYRKPRKRTRTENDKRPRTAFSSQQLQRLRHEFDASPYLSESRRKCLAAELGLNESQVKIWFQNKRAKLKKGSGSKNLLAMKLMEEGLYNHSTIVVDEYDDNMNDKNDDDIH